MKVVFFKLMTFFLTLQVERLKASCFNGGRAILIIFFSQCLSISVLAGDDFEIEVEKPKFVLPQFTGAFREREASIAPEEYEVAEKFKVLLENEKTDEVVKELEKYYDIEISPAIQTLKAQIYFSLKMYDKAEKTYLAVLKRKPQLIRAHSDLGQLYLLNKNPKKARHHFARAVEFGSNEAIIHGQLAYLNLTNYGPFSAISEYQQAMALEPENMQWQQGLLAALTKAKMFESASALLREIMEKNPLNSNLWLSQATLALKQDDNLSALAALEMSIMLGDDSETNVRTAAQLHLQMKSFDRAFELLTLHLANVDFEMTTLNNYLAWMSQAKMWNQSSQLLDKAQIKFDKMSLDAQSQFYFHRAIVASALKKLVDSETYYNKSLHINPANGDSLLGLAKLNADSKNYVNAELMFIRAEAISGSEKEAMLGRAQMYIDQGDYDSALVHLKSAYNKFPDLFELNENIQIIQNIINAQNAR